MVPAILLPKVSSPGLKSYSVLLARTNPIAINEVYMNIIIKFPKMFPIIRPPFCSSAMRSTIVDNILELTCDDIQNDSYNIFHQRIPTFVDQRLNHVWCQNLNQYIKLQCVRKKYGEREKK